MGESNIVPECFVDTRIAEILGQAKGKYNHQHGCGNVANEMKNALKDTFALGIIDEDKHKGPQSKYFLEFDVITQESNLILKKHRIKPHYLILVCPEIEKWLFTDAEAIGINPANHKFNLPIELKGFIKVSKIKSIDKNEGFKSFIKTLVREEAPSITTLKKWIELFKIDQLQSLSNK
jgi:hypothetical protein